MAGGHDLGLNKLAEAEMSVLGISLKLPFAVHCHGAS
jgi:hypothetical protein